MIIEIVSILTGLKSKTKVWQCSFIFYCFLIFFLPKRASSKFLDYSVVFMTASKRLPAKTWFELVSFSKLFSSSSCILPRLANISSSPFAFPV